jgi:hypothetical protein
MVLDDRPGGNKPHKSCPEMKIKNGSVRNKMGF